MNNVEPGRAYLDELRSATIWRLLTIGLGAAWFWTAAATMGEPQSIPLLVFLLLLATTVIVYHIDRHRSAFTVPFFLIGLLGIITVIVAVGRSPGSVYLYVAPVLCAGILLRPVWGFAGAVLVNGLVLLLRATYPEFAAETALMPSIMLTTGFAVILGWSFAQNLYRTMDWMAESHQLNEQRTREAQLHRGQLHKALKDLDLAFSRLRRSNEALAWARWQAEESRQAKARFAANISHELRTPLNLIIGFADVMVTAPESYGTPLPAVYRGDLNAIYRNAKHLSDLIDDVLDLSQLEVDRMPLTRENGNLSQVIEEAIRMIDGMVEAKGLQLTFNRPANPVPLSFDITRIRQVILNLLSNAARFTKTGGITVDFMVETHQAVVTVTDTGPGLDVQKIAHIFEEFYQVDDTMRREHGGTGLGLAISKRFVELHGGRIWVSSVPGAGSTFGFSLPLSSLPAGAELTGPVDSAAPNRRTPTDTDRILVVQHYDPFIATLFQRYFENYQIKVVNSSQELLNALIRWRPTAVIVDSDQRVAMNALLYENGWDGVPLISCPLPTRPSMAMELQSNDYLLKPVTRDTLRRAMGKVSLALRKVLIVDDDPSMVRLLTRMVKAEQPDTRVLQAHSGAAALDIIRHEAPDLLLLDLLMPGLTGLELLHQVRREKLAEQMVVFIVTATELGEQVTRVSGELTLTVPNPLAGSEWIHLLRGLTAALRPVPESTEASVKVLPAALPD